MIAFFKKRWVISLLGVLALILLVWFAGPFVAIAGVAPLASETVRLVVVLVILLAWGLNNLRQQMRAQTAEKEIAASVAEAGEAGGAVQEEVAQLRERFDEALAVLRKSKGKRGGGAHSLYELPWYIIIGPPGSGKTTALVNSGLHFPLADRFGKKALRGVGGTRNCDWWFTDEAILLDTAGRYLTQDSDAEVDSGAWTGFLALLKKHRRRRPINGVMLTMSLADLMLLDEAGREAHVEAMRARLQELSQHLGMRFPVYMMFTKCDLVAGFTEFFDDLGREERAQVWGTTFDAGAGAEAHAGLGEEYEALLGRLNDRLLARLQDERDPRRRALIYGFPQQIASLQDLVVGFVDAVFRPSRFAEAPMLRGVYLTSGTQEGTPIDRIMGALARNFGVDQQSLSAYGEHGRSYFITHLLQRVIFAEQDLAGANRRFERQRRWLQRGAYAAALLVTLGAGLWWSVSFARNQADISRLRAAVKEYAKVAAKPLGPKAGFAALLPRLDALRSMTEIYGQYGGKVPWALGGGLYQGQQLGTAADAAYQRELNLQLETRIGALLARQLNATTDPQLRYQALKLYLMLGEPERLNPSLLTLWMQVEWQRELPTQTVERERLARHLQALIKGGLEPLALDRGLVERVRAALRQIPLAEMVYGELKEDASSDQAGAFRLSDVIGGPPSGVFVRADGKPLDTPIPALYTYRGFYEIYQKESRRLIARARKDRWVLGLDRDALGKAALDQLGRDMLTLYTRDYIAHWQSLLDGLRLVPMNSLQEATRVAEVLSGPRSPMVTLLRAVRQNTALNKPPAGAAALAKASGGALAAAKKKLEKLLGAGGSANHPAEPPGTMVAKHFASLDDLVSAPAGTPPPINRIIGVIADDFGYLTTMANQSAAPAAATASAAAAAPPPNANAAVLVRLEVESARLPEPVRGWLRQLARASRTLTNAKVASETRAAQAKQRAAILARIDSDWKNNVAPVCRTALDQRYPFFRSAGRAVTLADFGRVLGPQGLLASFFKKDLEPYVNTAQRPWRWQASNGISLGLPASALRVFETAARIREVFFQNGGSLPSVNFDLKPVSLDPRVTAFKLDLDGQHFSYRHGPVRALSAQWPGAKGTGIARIVFEDANGASHALTEEGPWAWFRLLDRSKVKRLGAAHLLVTFDVKGRSAQWEILANSVVNPFEMTALEGFTCPSGF